MGFKPRFFSENFRGMRGMKWGTWRGALTGVCRGMKIHSCSALWFTGFESPSKPRTASVARFATSNLRHIQYLQTSLPFSDIARAPAYLLWTLQSSAGSNDPQLFQAFVLRWFKRSSIMIPAHNFPTLQGHQPTYSRHRSPRN